MISLSCGLVEVLVVGKENIIFAGLNVKQCSARGAVITFNKYGHKMLPVIASSRQQNRKEICSRTYPFTGPDEDPGPGLAY